MRKEFGAIALLAAVAFNIDTASASTFSYSSISVTNSEVVNIQTPRAVTGLAGQIVLNGSGANAGQTMYAWCLDIFNDLMQNGATYQTSPLSAGSSSGGSNPQLSATQLASIGSLMLYGNAHIGTAHVSAATQLAIWEVEYGSSFQFNTSGVSSATLALVNTLLSGVSPGGNLLVPNTVTLLSGPGNQSLGVASTPLPAAWLMFISGMAGLRFFVRRRTSNAAAIA